MTNTHIQKWHDSDAREQTCSVTTVAAKRKPRNPGGCAPARPGSGPSSVVAVVAPPWSVAVCLIARQGPPQNRRMEVILYCVGLRFGLAAFGEDIPGNARQKYRRAAQLGK